MQQCRLGTSAPALVGSNGSAGGHGSSLAAHVAHARAAGTFTGRGSCRSFPTIIPSPRRHAAPPDLADALVTGVSLFDRSYQPTVALTGPADGSPGRARPGCRIAFDPYRFRSSTRHRSGTCPTAPRCLLGVRRDGRACGGGRFRSIRQSVPDRPGSHRGRSGTGRRLCRPS
jgi:hypothetical protein